jgi:hypothetical protein
MSNNVGDKTLSLIDKLAIIAIIIVICLIFISLVAQA